MSSSFNAILPNGKPVVVTFSPIGITLARLKIPWSNIHFVESPEPREVVITTIAATGDHVKLTLRDCRVYVDEDILQTFLLETS